MAPPIVLEHEAPPDDGEERRFPCKGCGAGLHYIPGSLSIQCSYCGFKENIPHTADEISEFCYNEYLAKPKRGLGVEGRDVQCQPCAAIIRFEAQTKSTRCPFCGTVLVDVKSDEGGGDVRPEAVAPFAITQKFAENAFHKWVRSLWFAPGLLKQEANRTQIRGVYCPYWTYDAHTMSSFSGLRGDHYYVTQTYTTRINGKPATQTRQVRRTRWRPVSGTHEQFFDDTTVCGSGVDLQLSYSKENLKPYDPAFLAGFDAQLPDIRVEDGWGRAKSVISDRIRAACCRKIGGDVQTGVKVQTAWRGITFKMVLLPVFVSTYRYKNKTYRFQVDGQTGKVSGQRPWSFWKIAGLLCVIALLLLSAALAAGALTNR